MHGAIELPASSREALRQSLDALETSDLLALGARFTRDTERLILYLEVLRGRQGPKAQLAACLICFDLARQGHASAQKDFFNLIPTFRALAEDPALVEDLLGGDQHLDRLWRDAQAAIADDDPREGGEELDAHAPLAGEIDLVSDLDVDIDLGDYINASRRAEHAKAFARVVARKLGYDLENGILPTTSGMALDGARDIEELEEFLREAMLFSQTVPLAHGLCSLGNLFLATHLRKQRLFGRPNRRRQEAIRAGLLNLPADDPLPLVRAAALFEEEGAGVVSRFQKVSELLLDYLGFCARHQLDPLGPAAVDAYVAADRTPVPLMLQGDPRRRR
ncbi:MAG TPA: hypothetical protein VKY51_06870 [Fredinandcohnia sp.]|nr:hypothetical protein [Fredinandcohnia sp.]